MPLEQNYSFIKITAVGILGLFVQTYFIPIIEIAVWRPDVILLIVIYTGYRYGVTQGTLMGFILGLFQDAISPGPVGISSLANCMIGFAAGQTKQLKLAYNAKILVTIILILAHGGLYFLFYQYRTESTYMYLIITRVFPNTIYTFLIGFLISLFMRSRLESL